MLFTLCGYSSLGGGGGGGRGSANGLVVIYLSAACLKFACLALGVEESVCGWLEWICLCP